MDFDAALQHVLEQVRAAGIPASAQIDPQVRVNTRAKKRYGRCIFRDGRYEIELSARLQAADSSVVHTVLAHEVLHTCPGCMNHGARWKQYAAKMGGAVRVFDSAHGGLRPSTGAAADGNTLFAAVHVLRRGVCAAAHEQARTLSGALPLPVRRQAAAVTLRA